MYGDGVVLEDVCMRQVSHGFRWPLHLLDNLTIPYGGLDVNAARRLKQLEDENRRLKQLVAELTLDHAALKDVVAKKW